MSEPSRVVGRATRAVIVVALAIWLAGCGSGKAAESVALIPRAPGNLNGTDWKLVGTGDSDAVPASTPLTLRIDQGTASGNGPCNRYHLSFTHTSGSEDVTTGPIASTLIACAPPLAAAEHTFFRALEAVDTAQMESRHLVLSGPGDVRLTFERVKP